MTVGACIRAELKRDKDFSKANIESFCLEITAAKPPPPISDAVSHIIQQNEMVFTFVALLALVAFCASTIPIQPPLFLPNSTATTSPSDPSTHCIDVSSEHSLRTSDCKAAAAILPEDEDGDVYIDPNTRQHVYPEFSTVAREERHRLPLRIEAGSCIVEVRLAPGALSDYSSWRIIGLRVGNVIRKCVERSQGLGGQTVTGEWKGIQILLYAPHASGASSPLQMTRNGNTTLN